MASQIDTKMILAPTDDELKGSPIKTDLISQYMQSQGIVMNRHFIERVNRELNNVVNHLKAGDYEQAEELARKIAFNIPENYKDDFWLNAVLIVIRTGILAIAEDVVSAKKEKIDLCVIDTILESKQFVFDDFIDSRADNSLAKETYKPIRLMLFETRNRIIGESIISIKLRLQNVED